MMVVFLVVVTYVQPTRAAPSAKHPSVVRDPTQCPRIFGNEVTRTANKGHRAKSLHFVIEETAGITIAHSHASWSEPIRLKLTGIELVAQVPRDPARAVVRISREIADEIGCPEGYYEVRKDDSLGHNIRVLAVLRGVLLVEHQGMLTYLTPKEILGPRWVCGWMIRGKYRIQVPMSGGRSAPPKQHKKVRKAPARRPKPKPRVVH